MDGKLSQTELSSFELLSIFDLRVVFFHTKFWFLHSNHALCSLETNKKTHLISFYTIFLFLKLHTKHQVCVFLIW